MWPPLLHHSRTHLHHSLKPLGGLLRIKSPYIHIRRLRTYPGSNSHIPAAQPPPRRSLQQLVMLTSAPRQLGKVQSIRPAPTRLPLKRTRTPLPSKSSTNDSNQQH